MDNSIYVALSRQTAAFRHLDVVASNIANANTPGYKAEEVLFEAYLQGNDGNDESIAYLNDVSSYRDDSQGRMQVTNETFDVAIEGEGYFSVQTPLGERYTRAGNFQINAEGNLSTVEGYPVLSGDGQPVTIDPTLRNIVIGERGNISANGEEIGAIGVKQFANTQLLDRVGNNLYKSDVGGVPSETGFRVVQGALEMSNVSAISEMTELITVSKNVSSAAKLIESMYDLQRKTSSTFTRNR
jgi:flagellar basal-body rod protein FlgF